MSPSASIPGTQLNILEIAQRIKSSRSNVEELVRQGMPCRNIAASGRRRRRLRFDLDAVLAWLDARGKRAAA
jgi:phage terminase Nu1 subunit (DNA packaging protein)